MEIVTLLNGVVYFMLFPFLKLAPELFFKTVLLGADYEKYGNDETVINSMSGVFIALACVISIAYIYTGFYGYRLYVSISVMQRLTVVFLSVLITSFVIDQAPFDHDNFQYTMFFLADVFPALITGELSPGGLASIMSE